MKEERKKEGRNERKEEASKQSGKGGKKGRKEVRTEGRKEGRGRRHRGREEQLQKKVISLVRLVAGTGTKLEQGKDFFKVPLKSC